MLASPTKVIFPKTGHTRQQIADYYKAIAPVMLPFMKDKAVSLVRAPHGAGDFSFYQRHPEEYFPKYIERVKIAEKEGKGVYILIDSYEDIEYLVNIGTIEFHTWQAHPATPTIPTAMLFDLDPGPDVTVERLREAAYIIHERLDWQGMPNFVKTSGIQGFHIISPLSSKAAYDEIHTDARALAEDLSAKYPHLFTAAIKKSERKEKIFIDYLRNSQGATNVAPFSVRAINKPSISVPITWNEVDTVTPDKWTIDDVTQKDFLARAQLWV